MIPPADKGDTMADLLGATNRVAGYESINNKRAQPPPTKPTDLRIQNVPDTTRVSRADGRTERQGADDPLRPNALRYDSNLQAFLQQLRDAPDLPQSPFPGADLAPGRGCHAGAYRGDRRGDGFADEAAADRTRRDCCASSPIKCREGPGFRGLCFHCCVRPIRRCPVTAQSRRS